MFSTVISPTDVLIEAESRNRNILMYNAGTPIAIPIYTVLPYCVIIGTQVVDGPLESGQGMQWAVGPYLAMVGQQARE